MMTELTRTAQVAVEQKESMVDTIAAMVCKLTLIWVTDNDLRLKLEEDVDAVRVQEEMHGEPESENESEKEMKEGGAHG
jgi:RES domain-containing protein